MADFYCPRCILTGDTHDACTPTGAMGRSVGRFGGEPYTTVQLKCDRCAHLFWSGRRAAVQLAADRGFTFRTER